VAYLPHREAEARLPEPEVAAEANRFTGFQYFPATAPTEAQPDPPRTKDDRSFALCGVLGGQWSPEPAGPRPRRALLRSAAPQPFRLDLTLFTTLDVKDLDVKDNVAHAPRRGRAPFRPARRRGPPPVGSGVAEVLVGIGRGVRRPRAGTDLVP
jgi:hypothetical protein